MSAALATTRKTGISDTYAKELMENNDIKKLDLLLYAFFPEEGQNYLPLSEYSYCTAMTLLNYATIYYLTGRMDDEIVDLLVETFAVSVNPREFARSIATFCGYDSEAATGIPAKILSAIRTGEFDSEDFKNRLSTLSGEKFALVLGYIANSRRLKEVRHTVSKYIVMQVYNRRLLPVEQLLPIIAMNLTFPDNCNNIGAALLAISKPTNNQSSNDQSSNDNNNVVPLFPK